MDAAFPTAWRPRSRGALERPIIAVLILTVLSLPVMTIAVLSGPAVALGVFVLALVPLAVLPSTLGVVVRAGADRLSGRPVREAAR